jgi:hypothetical protein
MSLFEVSKHVIGVVFHNRVLYVHVISVRQLGHFGVRRYCSRSCCLRGHIVEVGSYDLLLLLDSFRDFWHSSTKCLGVRHFLAKWFGPPHLWHVNALPLPFPLPFPFPRPLVLFFMFLPLCLPFLNLPIFL